MRCISKKRKNRKSVEVCDPGKVIGHQLIPWIKAASFRQHIVCTVFQKPAEALTNSILPQVFQPCAPDFVLKTIHRILQVFFNL